MQLFFYYLQLESLFRDLNIAFRISETPIYCRLATANDPQMTYINFITISGSSITIYSFSQSTNNLIILKNAQRNMHFCTFPLWTPHCLNRQRIVQMQEYAGPHTALYFIYIESSVKKIFDLFFCI